MVQKHIDNIGKSYGWLTILGVSRNKYYKYTCICECGNLSQPNAHAVLNGSTISCGCYWEYSVRGEKKNKPRSDIKYGKKSSAANYVFHTYKRNASKRGLIFMLNKDQFVDLIVKDCCYCGCSPQQASRYWGKDKSPKFIYNGVDRVDNNLGYTLDNCVACCNTCNKAKSDKSLEEFKDWICNLINFYKGAKIE